MAKAAQVDLELDTNKLTWKEFKELCEKNGICDDDIVDDIDISWGKREFFKCEKDENCDLLRRINEAYAPDADEKIQTRITKEYFGQKVVERW